MSDGIDRPKEETPDDCHEVTIGTLGAGVMGSEHAGSLLNVAGVEVAAVFSRDRSRALAAAKICGAKPTTIRRGPSSSLTRFEDQKLLELRGLSPRPRCGRELGRAGATPRLACGGPPQS